MGSIHGLLVDCWIPVAVIKYHLYNERRDKWKYILNEIDETFKSFR